MTDFFLYFSFSESAGGTQKMTESAGGALKMIGIAEGEAFRSNISLELDTTHWPLWPSSSSDAKVHHA